MTCNEKQLYSVTDYGHKISCLYDFMLQLVKTGSNLWYVTIVKDPFTNNGAKAEACFKPKKLNTQHKNYKESISHRICCIPFICEQIFNFEVVYESWEPDINIKKFTPNNNFLLLFCLWKVTIFTLSA